MYAKTLKQTGYQRTSSAICVQHSDDSLNSAIHTAYRALLRPSSLCKPRYPLLEVLIILQNSTTLYNIVVSSIKQSKKKKIKQKKKQNTGTPHNNYYIFSINIYLYDTEQENNVRCTGKKIFQPSPMSFVSSSFLYFHYIID